MTLFELATLLDVEHNYAFSPRENQTFCNDYAAVFCAARGALLPPITANDQFKWLNLGRGAEEGWTLIGQAEAITRANSEYTVIAIATALPHGHVAPLVESPNEDPNHVYVSAAGAHNFIRTPLERSFGPLVPLFFLHTPEE